MVESRGALRAVIESAFPNSLRSEVASIIDVVPAADYEAHPGGVPRRRRAGFDGAAQEQFIFLNPLGRHVPSGDREHASWTHHYRAGWPTRPPTFAPTKSTGITA